MVSDFKCLDCELQFSVGAFHYHNFSHGYGGRVLSVCRHCGTPHSIETALHERGDEFWEIYEIIVDTIAEHGRVPMMIRLRQVKKMNVEEARRTIDDLPFTFKQELTESTAKDISKKLGLLGIGTTIRIYERRKNPGYGPLMADRLMSPGFPCFNEEGSQKPEQLIETNGDIFQKNGDINSEIKCAHCHKDHSLARSWSPECKCPNCKGSLKIISEWIT
ncbi:hypothetical protein [Undibacterium sp. TS12]|uniref:hypothetical protein n=1 Tax=Undibacterium sp. TS12 TaxID=2908202 RepID=UPI001F4C5FF6|nr:hypothetical protein [Undibacterium sp. TS12]MCH8618203.1 hypothetical protein [Undibacterium sp. TS12]